MFGYSCAYRDLIGIYIVQVALAFCNAGAIKTGCLKTPVKNSRFCALQKQATNNYII